MALTFRFAQETDTLLILQFIRELADYEHLLDQVVADEATLRDHGGLDRLPPYRTGIAEAGRTGISGCGNR